MPYSGLSLQAPDQDSSNRAKLGRMFHPHSPEAPLNFKRDRGDIPRFVAAYRANSNMGDVHDPINGRLRSYM